MSYSFQISSDAAFGQDGSMRERLFGKSRPHNGLRVKVPLLQDKAGDTDLRPGKLLRRNLKALAKSALSASRAEERPASEPIRRRLPVEYLGYLITNEQQADGRWVAGFLRVGDAADCAHRSAPQVASYMAFADAKRQIDAALSRNGAGNREFQRIPVALDGTIFANGSAQDCQILDLSGGGARLRRDNPTELTGEVLLYIKGFGRFRTQIVRCGKTEVGVRFIVDNEVVLELLKGLSSYVKGFDSAQTKLRREVRIPTSIAAVCRMPDGAALACEIIDASMRSMSIRITERPRIGALVTLGRTKVRVIRHHSQGIAVQCLPSPSAKSGRFNLKEE